MGSLLACLGLLVSAGAITATDGRSMYETARSFADHGTLAIDPSLGFPGRDGLYYAPHGLGLPLLSLLVYLILRPLAGLTAAGQVVVEAGVASIMPLVAALLGSALFLLARRLGSARSTALVTAVGAIVGTYLLPYTKDFYADPLAALGITLATERMLAGSALGAGSGMALASITRPQLFLTAPLLVWRLAHDQGVGAAMRAAVPLGLGLVTDLAYNFARFGDPLQFGYPGLGFSTPPWVGLAGLLIHPQKTILLFAPVVILLPTALTHLWRRQRSAFWLLAGNLALVVALDVTWIDWAGGWTWGPRLLIAGIIPALAALAPWADSGGRMRKAAVVALFAAGLAISAPAVPVSTRAQLAYHPPVDGPSVIRQYQLLPEAFREPAELDLWQVRLVRHGGRRGLELAVAISLALAGGAVASTIGLKTALAAERVPFPPATSRQRTPAPDSEGQVRS